MGWNRNALVTAKEAVTRLDVAETLIRRWAHDGRIHAAGKRGRAKLYRWGELVDVETATRMSRRSSRNEHRPLKTSAAVFALAA